jgi:hypothetical protein
MILAQSVHLGEQEYTRISEIAAVVLLAVTYVVTCGCSAPLPQETTSSATSPHSTTPKSYSTNFSLAENPISENSNWISGQTAGGNLWGDVQTNGQIAFGVSEPTEFGDPTAVLTGTWSPEQSVTGVVNVSNAPTGNFSHEVELRLRTVISHENITGYEAYCSVMPDHPYCHVARWNGPNGSWCNIESSTPITFAINGDVLVATATGTNPTRIKMYKNGIQILEAVDRGQKCDPGGAGGPFVSGNPGIGFYNNADKAWSNFGFSSFSAKNIATNP